MAQYVGIKSILSQFWKKEQEKNDAKYLTSADIANFVDSDTIDSRISTAIAGMSKLHFTVVSALPESEIDETSIYLVAETTGDTEKDTYGEFIYINGKWEKLGTTSTVSVEGYLTETNAAATYQTKLTEAQLAAIENVSKKVETVNGIAITEGTSNVVITATDINTDTEGITVQDAIDDVATRTTALENAKISIKVNKKDAIVTKDENGNSVATVTVTGSDIAISDSDTTTITTALANAGKVDDVQVSTDGSSYTTVITDKIAKINLSGYQTKLSELQLTKIDNSVAQSDIDNALTLTDNEFTEIFSESVEENV